jgi:hypothetical protein
LHKANHIASLCEGMDVGEGGRKSESEFESQQGQFFEVKKLMEEQRQEISLLQNMLRLEKERSQGLGASISQLQELDALGPEGQLSPAFVRELRESRLQRKMTKDSDGAIG